MEVPGRKRQKGTSTVDITLCEPCSQDGETFPAEAFCSVCREFLCKTCSNVHRKLRATKSHALLDKSNITTPMRLKPDEQESIEPCEIHPKESIKYFCSTHQTLTCGHCLAFEHRSCDITLISEISKDFKDGLEHGYVYRVIDRLIKDIDACVSNVENRIELVKKLGTNEINKLRMYRDEVTQYFEEREKSLLKKVRQLKANDETMLDSLTPKCNNLKSKVETILSQLKELEGNNSQFFIKGRRALPHLRSLQSALVDIKKETCVQQYLFIKDPLTEKLLASTTGLGIVEKTSELKTAESTPYYTSTSNTRTTATKADTGVPARCDQNKSRQKERRSVSAKNRQTEPHVDPVASIKFKPPSNTEDSYRTSMLGAALTFKPSADTEDIHLTSMLDAAIKVKPPSDTEDCYLTSMLLLPGERLLLVDCNNDTVMMMALQTSSLVSQISMPGTPWDLCLLPRAMVAVTMPNIKSIQYMETEGHLSLLGNSIKVRDECYGIGYLNGRIVVSYNGGRVEMIDLNGKTIKMIDSTCSGRPAFEDPCFVEIIGEGHNAVIYVSDSKMHTITKFDTDLRIIQTFKEHALRQPTGMSAIGNQLLICGYTSNNILSLDMSTGQMKQLLIDEKEILQPCSVCYCPHLKKLYVICYMFGNADLNNTVFVYKMPK
ncbi:uncharacterized protein LOC128246811 [Mya arenaria]|uniref:uncharacterized protein LOC128246811 n=1 Tax=Mya arenaria TaxID=6604 RepID=UPI0022E52952|nr:uncharacterized protein LOC128246811 [Mya arenaria]